MTLPFFQALGIVLLVAGLTLFTRLLPFLLFGGGKSAGPGILYLGGILPSAVIAVLVVYCLKGVRPLAYPYGLPELFAVAAVAALHLWKRNTLLSIGAGTVLYMFLVQVAFT